MPNLACGWFNGRCIIYDMWENLEEKRKKEKVKNALETTYGTGIFQKETKLAVGQVYATLIIKFLWFFLILPYVNSN